MSAPEALNARRTLGIWLALWALMLFVLILIGGATRLTESGLSITEWKPVSGVIPPIGTAAWQEAFRRYQQIPQFAALHADMSLSDFKQIFLWEYSHRLWARLVGVAFAVPLLLFLWRGMVPRELRGRLWLLLVLLGAQGALGWFMVSSGLSVRTEVSQYRLAAHLSAALLIYCATVWTAAELLASPRPEERRDPEWLRGWALGLLALALLTAVAGAFVAGLRAGRVFNTFPLMGGRLIPPGYGMLAPWWRNLFENPGAAQFDHRLLATVTLLSIVACWMKSRAASLTEPARQLLLMLVTVAAMQVGLGIATLLLRVPVTLGVLHQGGAVLLVTVALLLYRDARPATR